MSATQATRESRNAEYGEFKSKKEFVDYAAKNLQLTVDPEGKKMVDLAKELLDAEFPPLTREQRKVVLDAMTPEELVAAADAAKVTPPAGTDRDGGIKLILDAEYGVEGAVAGNGAEAGSDASKAPQKGKNKAPEKDPLELQYEETQADLTALYDELVVKIKEVVVPGGPEVDEQKRAGAVQFLKQCSATLEQARQFLESAKGVVEQNNKQLQSIEKAKQDLIKRSDDYNRMTTPAQN